VAAAIALQISSTFDREHAGAAQDLTAHVRVETSIGPSVWLCLAGVVAGLLATVAIVIAGRPGATATEVPGKLS
jgi:hypothetical protein